MSATTMPSRHTPVGRVLGGLRDLGRDVTGRGDSYLCQCSAHEDDRASLAVTTGNDGRALVHCHAGCDAESIVSALGLTMRDLMPETPAPTASRGRILATYDYRDENGELLYQAVRMDPKDFRQRRPDPTAPNGWTWKLDGVRRVLYRLPEIIEAVALGRTVFVAEGEKDVEALVALGLDATTNSGGADKWRAGYSETLAGATVVILPDNDEPGRQHARHVHDELVQHGCGVTIVPLPGLPEKGDVSDWLRAGGTREELERLATATTAPPAEVTRDGAIPAPLGVAAIEALEEPVETYHVKSLLAVESNNLLVAYPKSHKTNTCLELAVAGASARPFLGRFPVPRALRVGLVLMEDRPHRVRRRLQRIALGHGLSLSELEGRLFVWFRPPLKLDDAVAMRELAAHVARVGLDLLLLDNWSLVGRGNPDLAQDVTPQLQALSGIREACPGLSVVLVHHAKKGAGEGSGDRLTDYIRNSTAFPAWYDTGLLLTRTNEHAPVTVRVEMRDLPAPPAFAFTVEDEVPGDAAAGIAPSGWLRLRASDTLPSRLEQGVKVAQLREPVLAFLLEHPGSSKAELERGVRGDAKMIRLTLETLCQEGAAHVDSGGRGKPTLCYAGTSVDLGATSVNRTLRDTSVPRCAPLGATEPTEDPLALELMAKASTEVDGGA